MVRVESDGSQTVVQDKTGLGLSASASIAGYCANANLLINGWGPGTYILRDYIGDELIAQGQFSLTAS